MNCRLTPHPNATIESRARMVMDVFKASTWARENVRITGDNWRFEDFEPDSLSLVELVMEAERAFGIEVRDETFFHCKTVGAVAGVIAEQLAAAKRSPLAVYDGGLPMRAPARRHDG